jgi:hypothetical protein
LVGPIDFGNLQDGHTFWTRPAEIVERALDWVIVGGESGPGARPMDLDWARSLRDQCKAAGVPMFFKQLGAHPFCEREQWATRGGGVAVPAHALGIEGGFEFRDKPKDGKGGDPARWPEPMPREFPKVEVAQ